MTRPAASALPLALLACAGGAPTADAPPTAALGLVAASIPEIPGAALTLRGCGSDRPVSPGEVELALPPQSCALRIYAERWDEDAFGAEIAITIRAGERTAAALPAPPDDAWLPLTGAPSPSEDARMDALEARWIGIESALAELRALPGCPEAERLEAMGAPAEVADQLLALESREPFLLPSQEALAAQMDAAVLAAAEACGRRTIPKEIEGSDVMNTGVSP